MKQINKQTFKSASFVMAGGACLIGLIGHYLRIDGPLHVRGIQFLTSLVIPVLCFWVGMLIRYKVGKPKWWLLALAAVLAGVSFYFSRHTVNNLSWVEIRFLWYFLILAGFLLPWEYLYERRDREGIKSFILLVITALLYGVFELYWNRVSPYCMKPEHEDMATLLMVVTTNVIPLAVLLPVFFAAEFSLSNPAQWLGGQKWFRWIVGIAAVVNFIGALPGLRFSFGVYDMPHWIMFFVQPFTIFLIVVICRIVCKLRKKEFVK